MEKYYIVDSTILPDVLDKVIEARSLLQNGEVKQVSEAVKRVGISRGTYYKYKDYVFLPAQGMSERKAVISLMLHHDKGILSEVLNTMSSVNANILTINQNSPIHEWRRWYCPLIYAKWRYPSMSYWSVCAAAAV